MGRENDEMTLTICFMCVFSEWFGRARVWIPPRRIWLQAVQCISLWGIGFEGTGVPVLHIYVIKNYYILSRVFLWILVLCAFVLDIVRWWAGGN